MKAVLTLAICLLCVACSKQADGPTTGAQQALAPDAGPDESALTRSADGVLYVNDFLGLQVSKPEGWYAQSPEETMKMSQIGVDDLAKDAKVSKAMLAASMKSTLPVFGFFEVAPGTPGATPISLLGYAENLSILPGIKTGCDYLWHVRKLLQESGRYAAISEGCSQQTVNGTQMGTIEATMQGPQVTVTQKYLACVKGKHAIGVAGTWIDAPGAAKVDAALQTLKVQCQ